MNLAKCPYCAYQHTEENLPEPNYLRPLNICANCTRSFLPGEKAQPIKAELHNLKKEIISYNNFLQDFKTREEINLTLQKDMIYLNRYVLLATNTLKGQINTVPINWSEEKDIYLNIPNVPEHTNIHWYEQESLYWLQLSATEYNFFDVLAEDTKLPLVKNHKNGWVGIGHYKENLHSQPYMKLWYRLLRGNDLLPSLNPFYYARFIGCNTNHLTIAKDRDDRFNTTLCGHSLNVSGITVHKNPIGYADRKENFPLCRKCNLINKQRKGEL